MCGRYTLYDFDGIIDRFDIEDIDTDFLNTLAENYNVAPSQTNPVILRNSPNHIEMMRWGFIPFWAKDPSIGFKMINARAETVGEKTTFKKALQEYRCLIPANGFYEWKATGAGKVPYYIHLKDQDLFAFAGLYSTWKDAEGKEIKSYTIITTTPNTLMEDIHNRMPVILSKKNENIWLDKAVTDIDVLTALLKPYDAKKMEAYVVTKDVNSPKNNRPELIVKEKLV